MDQKASHNQKVVENELSVCSFYIDNSKKVFVSCGCIEYMALVYLHDLAQGWAKCGPLDFILSPANPF